jgi:hypothetical protein
VAFGVPLALGVEDGAGEAAPGEAACSGGLVSGVAIGLAGAGDFSASSATVSFIASSTGIRTVPLVLSTQA